MRTSFLIFVAGATLLIMTKATTTADPTKKTAVPAIEKPRHFKSISYNELKHGQSNPTVVRRYVAA
ncbi:hypothetical protein CCR75_005170 [Bremia lactucae]|uniref:RxLR effector protein n=1 Tax=Bremia lactucae TaxID=4779 RepID=A0A976FLI3_BRELC|nr:hypothetical protein CCR75_007494 [Bremia lactucae]TDH68694.1 hypothetical protein CCR75_005170 [Bremia lactucae]